MHDSFEYGINNDRIEYYYQNDPEIPEPSPSPHTYPIPEPAHKHENHSLLNTYFISEDLTINILVCIGALMFIGVYVVKCYDNYHDRIEMLRYRRRLDRINVDNLNTLILCEDLPEESCSVCLQQKRAGYITLEILFNVSFVCLF